MDNTHAHCAYASSARFAIDSPCCKPSLRSVWLYDDHFGVFRVLVGVVVSCCGLHAISETVVLLYS